MLYRAAVKTLPHPQAKDILLQLIDREVFEPVLAASPTDYTDDRQRARLANAQQAVQTAYDRYHRWYETGAQIYGSYKWELRQDAADALRDELRALELPTLYDIREDVERLAVQLRIKIPERYLPPME